MRHSRHDKVKHRITSLLQQKGFDCHEEVQCVDGQGSIRRADIVAFEQGTNRALIVDPSIRYETNGDMGKEVQDDKERRYASCASWLNEKFSPTYGPREYHVYGLWIGGRGTISRQVVQFFDEFQLDKRALPVMAEDVLVDSIRMLHHHVNGP